MSLAYLLISYALIGFRPEQLVLVGLCNACYYLSATTRQCTTGFSIFVVFWVLYNYLQALPNCTYRAVDMAPLYHTEKTLSGLSYHDQPLIPNEFWLIQHTAFLDVLGRFFTYARCPFRWVLPATFSSATTSYFLNFH